MNVSSHQLEEEAKAVRSTVAPKIEEAGKKLEDLNSRVIAFIRRRPGACLLGALALGFVIGKIASRR